MILIRLEKQRINSKAGSSRRRTKFSPSFSSSISRRGKSSVNVIKDLAKKVQILKKLSVPKSISGSHLNTPKDDSARYNLPFTKLNYQNNENSQYSEMNKINEEPK